MAGSIQKVGKNWRVTYERGKDANGTRLRDYDTFSSEREAKNALNEYKTNKQRNLLVQLTSMSFADFIEYWFDIEVKYNCEKTTMYGYRNIINNHLVPFLGRYKLQELATPHIQQYYNKFLMDEKGLSPNTVHKHHLIIKKALKFALKQQLVYRNVADGVTLPVVRKFKGISYTREQLNTLLDLVKGTKLEVPVYIAAYLGLRRQEVCGLKWEFVDFENRIIFIEEVRTSGGVEVIKPPKTEESRRGLHIEDELYEVLLKKKAKQETYKALLGKEYHDTNYVYTREDGKTYRVNTLSEQFPEFLAKNNLPKIRFHDLRHTFCSLLYDQGVPLSDISGALGHSEVGTTDKIYKHRLDKIHKKTVSVMGKVLQR